MRELYLEIEITSLSGRVLEGKVRLQRRLQRGAVGVLKVEF